MATGASKWGKPKEFPWTMGYQPDYHTEGAIYAKHILANVKDPKVGILMQNDDFGKDYLEGFKEGLGKDNAGVIAKLATYEVTDPTVESQIIQLKDTGANVFFNVATPKFAAQAIRKVGDLNWKPAQYMTNVSASVSSVMKPAGFGQQPGRDHGRLPEGPDGQALDGDADMKTWREWMAKYQPSGNTGDANYIYAYGVSYLMTETLKRCGSELTRANVMKQAAGFQKFKVPILLPGITINTSATDFYPIQSVQLQRFKGETWDLFGDVMSAEGS